MKAERFAPRTLWGGVFGRWGEGGSDRASKAVSNLSLHLGALELSECKLPAQFFEEIHMRVTIEPA